MNSNKRPGTQRTLTFIFVSFCCGYLAASFFTFTQAREWVSAQVLTSHNNVPAPKPVVVHAELPKPKFEFYTLLSKEDSIKKLPPVENVPLKTAQAPVAKVNDSTAHTVAVKSAIPVAAINEQSTKSTAAKKTFLVQIASFKSKQEADRMKVGLILKDFNASITSFNKDNTTWFRVVIGPYETRVQAEKAQVAVARSEKIMGMIRKMDA